MMKLQEALTFDDVLIQPSFSRLHPSEANTSTFLTKNIKLHIPLLSSAMDTVTESKLAVKIAQSGGVGVVHKNLSIQDQVAEIVKVKKFESGMVINPRTMFPDNTVKDAYDLKRFSNISGIPIIERKSKELVGILTNRDIRFAKSLEQPVSSLMTKDNLITVKKSIKRIEAKRLLHEHRIEKLLVVDAQNKCVGLITVKDIEKSEKYPHASKDELGRLIVGGAIGVGEKEGILRGMELIKSEVDFLVIDTAHGHSASVIETLKEIKKISKKIPVIVGNIATAEAASDLIKGGADCLKVGIGPGSICTTRIVAGVGVPQLHAISEVSRIAKKKKYQSYPMEVLGFLVI